MTETHTKNRIEQEMERNSRNYRRRVEEIRENPDLNDHARRRYLDEAYQEARATHGSLFDQQRQELRSRVAHRRKEALAPPTKYGADRETVQLSYRDALSRVEDITDSGKLTAMLQRAEVTGDDVLAKAILARGYELQDERVVGAYLEAYPNHQQSWNRFMDSAQEYNTLEEQCRMFGDLGPEKPRELGGVG